MGGGLLRVVRGRAHFLHRGARAAGIFGLRATALKSQNPLRQRADLTFKQNLQNGRHGWLRLTPAYSVQLVEQLLQECGQDAQVVFDPFSGSGTTALCAAYRGKTGVATDINPFLIWLANAKARSYDAVAIADFRESAQLAVMAAADPESRMAEQPPISHIERWWSAPALSFLLRLKAAIGAHATDSTLLQVAFCRTIMKLSNAAFNHQSMSFRVPTADAGIHAAQGFLADVELVAAGAACNPTGNAQYLLADSRGSLEKWRDRVDLLITSPPYPNRMSYIRELRPYMYWLGFLSTGREAGELDWQAIGGTWGVATSRLGRWAPLSDFAPDGMLETVTRIRRAHEKNGPLLANYVHRYFEDMFSHLTGMLPLLRAGASVHYIVGNSIFYGHLVPAEAYLAAQMAALGLRKIQIVPIRKRNSKQGLVEFRVTGVRQT